MTAKWGQTSVKDIVTPVRGELVSGRSDIILEGISTDSRDIKPGQIFLALKGDNFDGHDFVEKAITGGASCLIIDKSLNGRIFDKSNVAIIQVDDTLRALGDLAGWWRNKHEITVVTITGSAGKTTTKEMTALILGQGAKTLKNRGNFNNLIGLPLSLLRLEKADRRAVLEMGMNRPGEIKRLTEIADPDIGLITNVARAHLEGLKDLEGVARAKTELIEEIRPDGYIIINGDDVLLMKQASRFNRRIITFGRGRRNDIRAENIINLGHKGISFDLRYHDITLPVSIRVPGIQNIHNALAASAVAVLMEESPDNIVKGLNDFEGIDGRFRSLSLPRGNTLIDDTYNANPYSLKAALDSIKSMAGDERRIIVGLGEMMELGDETSSAHIEAGKRVAEIGAS